MSGGLKWCELCLILYRTPFSTALKVNTTDAVTVCLFRIFTVEQIILNPVTVAKHLFCFDSFRRFMCCDFRKNKVSSQTNTAAGHNAGSDRSLFQHSCQLANYAKLRPLAVCIHKEESNLCKVQYN